MAKTGRNSYKCSRIPLLITINATTLEVTSVLPPGVAPSIHGETTSDYGTSGGDLHTWIDMFQKNDKKELVMVDLEKNVTWRAGYRH